MVDKRANSRLAYGITILIFGVLFLLDKTGFLARIPYGENALKAGILFLIAAIVFIVVQPKKWLGWVCLIISIILNADWIFGWLKNYSKLLVPLILILAGLILILTHRKK